ncbi:hypothetical protein H180DRAFT_02355 [Streptomyces sp. WMMB 322]|nr:hypothetical protein H180DRAFT_02355 [Streptomyces sp. WMMB 322]
MFRLLPVCQYAHDLPRRTSTAPVPAHPPAVAI